MTVAAVMMMVMMIMLLMVTSMMTVQDEGGAKSRFDEWIEILFRRKSHQLIQI